jgi:hypothetical protein
MNILGEHTFNEYLIRIGKLDVEREDVDVLLRSFRRVLITLTIYNEKIKQRSAILSFLNFSQKWEM